jgi:hypothetical protein
MAEVIQCIPSKCEALSSNPISPLPSQKSPQKTPMEAELVIHWFRITLNGHNIKSLEKVGADLIRDAKKKDLKVKGLVPCLQRL